MFTYGKKWTPATREEPQPDGSKGRLEATALLSGQTWSRGRISEAAFTKEIMLFWLTNSMNDITFSLADFLIRSLVVFSLSFEIKCSCLSAFLNCISRRADPRSTEVNRKVSIQPDAAEAEMISSLNGCCYLNTQCFGLCPQFKCWNCYSLWGKR